MTSYCMQTSIASLQRWRLQSLKHSLFTSILITVLLLPNSSKSVDAHLAASLDDGTMPLAGPEDFRPHLKHGDDMQKEPGTLKFGDIFSELQGSLLGKRQEDLGQLENNKKAVGTIAPGDTQRYRFSADQVNASPTTEQPSVPSSLVQRDDDIGNSQRSELKPRQAAAAEVFLTLSICRQPSPASGSASGPPPALELLIRSPGDCGSNAGNPQSRLSTDQGFLKHSERRSGDFCVDVRAPETPGYSGNYEFELAASVDTFYSNYYDFESLFVLDSDAKAGLFITSNLTNPQETDTTAIDQWKGSSPPFGIFIHYSNDTRLDGLMSSFCAMDNIAQVKANVGLSNDTNMELSITTYGNHSGNMTAKQRFYIPELNSSSSYVAVLALSSNYSRSDSVTPTGGGTIWKAVEFKTKTNDNCQVIYDLPFCSSVAYAVPSNGSVDMAGLRGLYDDYAQSFMKNFDYSLQQIPCDTEPEAQYSLATNCDECSVAYKQWLCAVTIPRCADFDRDAIGQQPRNANKPFPNNDSPQLPQTNETAYKVYINESRNAMIDKEIKPGPHNEIMPCGSLCFGLVQACPASLDFACPSDNQRGGFRRSYGYPGGNASYPHCNLPGTIGAVSAAQMLLPSMALTLTLVITFSAIGSLTFGG